MKSSEVDFWRGKWQRGETRWDYGAVHPLTQRLWDLANKHLDSQPKSVLIPGSGRGHDGMFFIENGFSSVTLLDISPEAIDEAEKLYAGRPEFDFLCSDILEYEPNDPFSIVFDRAMLCAIQPEIREHYIDHCYKILTHGGLFISIPFLEVDNPNSPPFPLSEHELLGLKGKFECVEFRAIPTRDDDIILSNGLMVFKK